jgi:hypothetical protein
MEPLALYAATLACTVCIEAPLVAGLCRRSGWRLAFAVAVLANLASHPVATALTSVAGVDWLVAETLVFTLEALAFRCALGVPGRQAWSASLSANAATAAVALVWWSA